MNAPAYYHRANPDLLQAIPLTARHVLEVGCGGGALAAAWRQRQPQGRWSGIELEPAAAAAARGTLDAVLQADIETLSPADLDAFLGEERPDTLVFGDVLEHLRDPLAALRTLIARLAPGGTVVACIPNIAHWSSVDRLLRGDWTYQDEGLLDRTHLRFFTRETAIQLLRDAGLTVLRCRPRNLPLDPQRQKTVMDQMTAAAPALGVDPQALAERLQALQYVLVAAKPPLTPALHLHQIIMVPRFMEARTLVPWAALSAQPFLGTSVSIRQTRLPEVAADQPKILVIQRQCVTDREAWFAGVRSLLAKNWVLVCEWDDHPDLLPESIKALWEKHRWLPMTSVHACQTSTPPLAEVFRQHNGEVEVFENALLDVPPLPAKPSQRIRVVFAALNRQGVNSMLAPVLNRVLARHPDCELVVVQNRQLYDSIDLPADRKQYIDSLQYGDYLELLATAHIALLPLVGSEPERYKSDLKYLECASRGAVCIASPTVYAATIRHGQTGWIAAGADEWAHCLEEALASPARREEVARAARDYVCQTRLQAQQVARREAWYRSLWERREELTAKLLERHPDLAP